MRENSDNQLQLCLSLVIMGNLMKQNYTEYHLSILNRSNPLLRLLLAAPKRHPCSPNLCLLYEFVCLLYLDIPIYPLFVVVLFGWLCILFVASPV